MGNPGIIRMKKIIIPYGRPEITSTFSKHQQLLVCFLFKLQTSTVPLIILELISILVVLVGQNILNGGFRRGSETK